MDNVVIHPSHCPGLTERRFRVPSSGIKTEKQKSSKKWRMRPGIIAQAARSLECRNLQNCRTLTRAPSISLDFILQMPPHSRKPCDKLIFLGPKACALVKR